jgi:hypothetical protein
VNSDTRYMLEAAATMIFLVVILPAMLIGSCALAIGFAIWVFR